MIYPFSRKYLLRRSTYDPSISWSSTSLYCNFRTAYLPWSLSECSDTWWIIYFGVPSVLFLTFELPILTCLWTFRLCYRSPHAYTDDRGDVECKDKCELYNLYTSALCTCFDPCRGLVSAGQSSVRWSMPLAIKTYHNILERLILSRAYRINLA